MIFCGKCGTQNNFPMSSMRTNRGPCEICGGFDKMQIEQRGGGVKEVNINNYSYPTNLLPQMQERAERAEQAGNV